MSQTSTSTPPARRGPRHAGRLPHEGAGPCLPLGGGRFPGRTGRRAAAVATLTAALVTAMLGAALLAACGGSSDGGASSPPSSSASATPTPAPSPTITSGPPPAAAVALVREFWTLAGAGRLSDAKRSLVAPASPIQDWTGSDFAAARFVRLAPRSVGKAPAQGATIEFSVIVWIDPGAQGGPWGAAGEHQLFEHVVRMSDGTWRMYDSGTGP